MGVHTSFVRSVDLDEWTQRQIDSMRLGGNANAQQYFRSHGLSNMHSKIEKKYTSKAAKMYRAELSKQMDAEAAKRGEGVANPDAVGATGSLLENLELQARAETDAEARAKLAAARASAQPAVAQPTAKKASELAGAKKLVVTPPNSGGLKGGLTMLRKPASKPTTMSSMMMKKKKPATASKLGVSKLVIQKKPSADGADDHGFDDIGATQEATAKPEPVVEAKPEPEIATPAAAPAVAVNPKPSPVPVPPPAGQMSSPRTVKEGVARLKEMNHDFFSGI